MAWGIAWQQRQRRLNLQVAGVWHADDACVQVCWLPAWAGHHRHPHLLAHGPNTSRLLGCGVGCHLHLQLQLQLQGCTCSRQLQLQPKRQQLHALARHGRARGCPVQWQLPEQLQRGMQLVHLLLVQQLRRVCGTRRRCRADALCLQLLPQA
jgi:hypothetical protein